MKVTIDNKVVEAAAGTTVYEAARSAGISIPVMCYGDGKGHHPTCMVCLVKDVSGGRFFPACSMPVADGMAVQTHSPEIREMRRQSLELLLSDHVGDCEAPCRLSCPAFMDIPLMNRLIAGGHFGEALGIVREEIAIPFILGYICPAPCEKACHRRSVDQPLSICMLKRFTAQDEADRLKNLMNGAVMNGRRTAVIGSGPAGLSAAFYLRRLGYEVTIFEKDDKPGGTLRYSIPHDTLPPEVLDAEIGCLQLMGVEFRVNQDITAKVFEREIIPLHDAVILATGAALHHSQDIFSLPLDEHGNVVNRKTGATLRPGVFGCGSMIREQNMAVRSAAQGKLAAIEADLYIHSGKTKRLHFQFHSAINRLQQDEVSEYLKESTGLQRTEPAEGWRAGFTAEEAMAEASRCMHCDCRKPVTCRLRILSDEYQANRKRFSGPERKKLTKEIRHDLIVWEPEKCIKCGICIELAAEHGEELGLTFIGRGFDLHVGVPFGDTLREGISRSAFFCVEGCPTGALAFKDQEEGVELGKRYRMTRRGWEKIDKPGNQKPV